MASSGMKKAVEQKKLRRNQGRTASINCEELILRQDGLFDKPIDHETCVKINICSIVCMISLLNY
jgi:hypothetical protein